MYSLGKQIPVIVFAVLTVAISACVLSFSDCAYAATKNADSISTGSLGSSVEASLNVTDKKPKLKGLIERSSGIYYYTNNGKRLKNSWMKVGRDKYYFGSDGKAYTGNRKVDGIRYYFDEFGVLYRSSKSAFIEMGKGDRIYYVTKKGQILTGWQLINNKLYHFSNKGVRDENVTVDKVKLQKNGKAKSSNAANAKIYALKILDKIVSPNASKSKKLKAAWNHLTSRKNYVYRSIYPNLSKKNWQYDTAAYMLKNRAGNCYSFACAFAAMAQVIGYEPYLRLGRVHGSRDGAADGFTRHAWVRINGKYYDPELRFASGYYFYGTGVYPMSTKNVSTKKF